MEGKAKFQTYLLIHSLTHSLSPFLFSPPHNFDFLKKKVEKNIYLKKSLNKKTSLKHSSTPTSYSSHANQNSYGEVQYLVFVKVREDGEAALAPELGTAEDDLRGRRGGDEELLRVRVTDLREKSLSIHREIGRRISEKIGYTAVLIEVKLDRNKMGYKILLDDTM